MDNKIENKQSGIELLKVLAMILIILFHISNSLVQFIDYENSGIESIIIWIFRNFGNVGNTIFVICSSWFLIDINKKKNIDSSKPIQILLDSCIISIIIFVICIVYDKSYFDISSLVCNLFPDIFRNVWFVPCYVIFYSISPLLNNSMKYFDRKKHLIFCFISFFLYGILGLFTLQPFYSQLIEFTIIYYLIAYIKFYKNDFNRNQRKNIICLIVFLTVYLFYLIFCNVELLNMSNMINILTTPICIFAFNVFYNIKLKNRFINYISSLTLYIYCFHENILLRGSVRNVVNELLLLYFDRNIVCTLIVHLLFVFVVSVIFSCLYSKTFHNISKSISVKIRNEISFLIDKLLEN